MPTAICQICSSVFSRIVTTAKRTNLRYLPSGREAPHDIANALPFVEAQDSTSLGTSSAHIGKTLPTRSEESDPSPNREFASTGSPSLGTALHIENLAEQYEDLVGHISSLEGEGIREHWMSDVMREWVQYEPDAVGHWINQLADGSIRDSALRIDVQDWVARSPREVADWALSVDDVRVRRESLDNAVYAWIGTGRMDEAIDWIHSQGSRPEASDVAFKLALKAYSKDHEEGNALAARIFDPEQYETFLKKRMVVDERQIFNNLRQIASAAQQFMLDEGVRTVGLDQIRAKASISPPSHASSRRATKKSSSIPTPLESPSRPQQEES